MTYKCGNPLAIADTANADTLPPVRLKRLSKQKRGVADEQHRLRYPCQNQSGMENYELCRSHYPVEPGIRPHIRDISLVNVTGTDVWRSGWLNCLPESPCTGVSLENVQAPGALDWSVQTSKPHTHTTHARARTDIERRRESTHAQACKHTHNTHHTRTSLHTSAAVVLRPLSRTLLWPYFNRLSSLVETYDHVVVLGCAKMSRAASGRRATSRRPATASLEQM